MLVHRQARSKNRFKRASERARTFMKSLRMLGFLLLIAGFSVVTVKAESAATLSGRIGNIQVQRNGAWMEARTGEQINPGEKVRTANGSAAAVELGPGKVVTLSENTQIEVRSSDGSLSVRLESGNMKVVSASDIQVSARDTTLQSAARPLDIDLGYQADKLNLTVNAGAVRTGPIIIRGTEDSAKRSYAPAANPPQYGIPFGYSNIYGNSFGYPNAYSYPYMIFANPGFAQPNVQNPYSGIMPGQIIAPMSDPLRPPVHFPIDTFPNRPPGTR
ncbi:MAG: hypothetical protein DMG12_26570 [Acidobacteria bacterium]|nr:MAG: hypothetical protein DMG12_26570 [Acidobacteriota bacterium]